MTNLIRIIFVALKKSCRISNFKPYKHPSRYHSRTKMGIGTYKLYEAIVAVLIIAALGATPLGSIAQEENRTSTLFSPESQPYGMTYGEWTSEWWQWFLSIPTDQNPINDPTGERCAQQQSGSVWFLVGSGGGRAERSCTIPAGVAILIPAINVECSFVEDESLSNEADLRACANSDQDLVTRTGASLDGLELEVHRVESPLFDVIFPADNIFAVPEGPTQAVSDGYWVFLKPLPPGNHELHAEGLLVDPTVTGPVNLVEDSTYHLTVEASSSIVYAETIAFADKSFDFPVSSTSTVSNVQFDEESKQLSFTLSGGAAEGITWMPISWLVEGPYTVVMNATDVSDYSSSENPETGGTTLTFVHSNGTYDVTITGTNVVPELPYSLFILFALISVIVTLGKVYPRYRVQPQ
jgi:hypothetical protein